MAYTKLFSSIVTSTIWRESDSTRIVWITLLALADKNGEVQGSIPGLAHLAGVTIEECEKAIKKLMSPDEYSRTQVADGRRLEKIDGGWELINHGKYRALASKEDAIASAAERKRRSRERNKVTSCHAESQAVTQNRDIADAEAYSDADINKDIGESVAKATPASDDEWLNSLSANTAYDGIDIKREFAKMQAWCSANKKQPTRRRFVNWLNRAERPMKPATTGVKIHYQ